MRPLGELVRQDSVLLVRASREGQDGRKKESNTWSQAEYGREIGGNYI